MCIARAGSSIFFGKDARIHDALKSSMPQSAPVFDQAVNDTLAKIHAQEVQEKALVSEKAE